MKKKITALALITLTLLLLMSPLCCSAVNDPDIHYAEHCCVANADTGDFIFEKGSRDRVAPAATVKMMTALLAIEHYGENLSQTVTVSAEAVDAAEGNSCGLKAGDSVLVSDLLAAVIIGNYNDAALALACDVGGSIPAFVDMMNARAAELGMNDTKYLNPTGLDESGMYTSAYDVTVLGKILAVMTVYTNFSNSPSYIFESIGENFVAYNHNYFISNYFNLNYLLESAVGLCGGKTANAGNCVCVVDKTSKGFTFVVTVMGAPEPEVLPFSGCIASYEDAIDLIRWASDSYELFPVVKKSDMIYDAPVKLSSSVDHVILLPAENLNVVFPKDIDLEEDITKTWTLNKDELVAPITEGEVVGTLTVTSKTKGFLGKVDLIAKSNVERSPWLLFLDRAKSFFRNPVVIVLFVLLLIALIAGIVIMSRYIARKHRRVRYRTPKDNKSIKH